MAGAASFFASFWLVLLFCLPVSLLFVVGCFWMLLVGWFLGWSGGHILLIPFQKVIEFVEIVQTNRVVAKLMNTCMLFSEAKSPLNSPSKISWDQSVTTSDSAGCDVTCSPLVSPAEQHLVPQAMLSKESLTAVGVPWKKEHKKVTKKERLQER